MKDVSTAFGLALRESKLRPLDYCRAVTKLTGQEYSPVMTSRWIQGVHEAPAPAVALAILLGRLPMEERKALIQSPPRKKYTRKVKGEPSPS
ncbi:MULTISPECIES: hypothetical protein [unclassified Desulfovibrio]|uniref:hypothetical protein n=1 Tax=unclassified Desulfovibrio TaxID=2593640 RepID=UPI002FD93967